jgi:hypothetical protein
MDLLHLVFTFNLVTALFTLAGCYYLHVKYDDNTTGDDAYTVPSGVSLAGVLGAGIGLGLVSSVATLFA